MLEWKRVQIVLVYQLGTSFFNGGIVMVKITDDYIANKDTFTNLGINVPTYDEKELVANKIKSIEEGKAEDFKDVFYLKYFIRDYAKYLGLDSEKILDEFNEFLFDITSKIPVDLIKNAKKDKSEEKKTASPYTKEAKKKIKIPKIFIIILIIVFLIIVCYAILSSYKGNDFSDKDITYSIRR